MTLTLDCIRSFITAMTILLPRKFQFHVSGEAGASPDHKSEEQYLRKGERWLRAGRTAVRSERGEHHAAAIGAERRPQGCLACCPAHLT